MSKSIITLGGGMVGSAIARDLKESNYNITVADFNEGVQSYLAPFDINYMKGFDIRPFKSKKAWIFN